MYMLQMPTYPPFLLLQKMNTQYRIFAKKVHTSGAI